MFVQLDSPGRGGCYTCPCKQYMPDIKCHEKLAEADKDCFTMEAVTDGPYPVCDECIEYNGKQQEQTIDTELEPDKFVHVCFPSSGANVQSEESLKQLSRDQQSCTDDFTEELEGTVNDQMITEGQPTLAGAHSHLTKHIQDHQDFYRRWTGLPDFDKSKCNDNSPCVLREVMKIKERLNQTFKQIDSNVDDMQAKINLIKQKLAHIYHVKNQGCPEKECVCENNFEWDQDAQECACPPPKIIENGKCTRPVVEERYDVESVLVIGGQGQWTTQFDALIFCPSSDAIQDTRDVVDNKQHSLPLTYFSTAVRTDYAFENENMQRFVFGGTNHPESTYFIVEKDFNGNDQALALRDAREVLGDAETAAKWKIPETESVYNGEQGFQTGKSNHRGITCLGGSSCQGRNFLIGGRTSNPKVASDSVIEWDERGMLGEVAKMNEGRSEFAAVAVDASFSHCNGILVMGGYGSGGYSVATKTAECFNGNKWTVLDGSTIQWVPGNGLSNHDMVFVRDDLNPSAVFSIGGMLWDDWGDRVTVGNIYKMMSGASSWSLVGSLRRPRNNHRSWVTYDYDEDNSDSRLNPQIFTVAGEGSGGEATLEKYSCDTKESTAFQQGIYRPVRDYFDAMVFTNGGLDLTLLPNYSPHCE